ncbi:hypothetical protein SNR37_001763 [Agarivorans aestuarii]|uniref:DUF2798 domain-containing protein n=1 Tax=Agarivorans aestuarii TaxID=1563703 RepID=A0ABU7FZ45_9ALTE|nr:hypothetical protein [Agarivorans aestuarii]MEE1672442.1 hypothetical protein [Agarivorans aestuarii]
MEVKETYSDEARIQLNFFSFMVIAVWVCFGVGIAFAIAFNFVVTTTVVDESAANTMFWFSSLMYGFLGFLFSLIGSALIYPIYKFWCDRMRGQRVKGKFALVRREL